MESGVTIVGCGLVGVEAARAAQRGGKVTLSETRSVALR
jgi:folate-dependent tRNA-U54 methylase TrmFO/GidA